MERLCPKHRGMLTDATVMKKETTGGGTCDCGRPVCENCETSTNCRICGNHVCGHCS